MQTRRVCRAGFLTALLFGCGPSTELRDVRRQAAEGAERYQSLVDLYARCVALEADEGESGGCGPIPPETEPLVY